MNCQNCDKPLTGRQKKYCSDVCKARTWDKEHPDATQEKYSRYAKSPKGKAVQVRREHNPERIEYMKEYKKNRLKTEKGQEYQRRKTESRRTRKVGAPDTLTAADWKGALAYFEHKCAYCGSALSKAYQEHFEPLAKGGGYTKDNIVPACKSCNSRKRDRNPLDWLVMQAQGLVAYVRVKQYLGI